MIGILAQGFASAKAKYQKFEHKNLLYIGVFIIILVWFWKPFVRLFKPTQDAKREASLNTNLANTYLQGKAMSSDGHFISGAGVKTIYTVTQARKDAETLASVLGFARTAGWWSSLYSAVAISPVWEVKRILNPGYPSSYRRYVIESYRSVYTDNRSLLTDVKQRLTKALVFDYWTKDMDKYFTL